MSFQANKLEYSDVWDELRAKEKLTDGLIICQDGSEFKIHRCILAAASPYFMALFTNSINRNQPEATIAKINIPGKFFKMFLDYAYTGTCAITNGNVKELVKYADQYQLLDLLKACFDYLFDNLNAANCLKTLQFANQYFCKTLIEKGKIYVRFNFSKIIYESSEFCEISFEYLHSILMDDFLNAKSENIVFDAIKRWVTFDPHERQRYLLSLLRCIRLGMLTYDCVEEISKWDLIQDNVQCKEYINDVLTVLGSLGLEDDIDYFNDYLFRPRVPYGVVFAVGGWSAGSPTNFLETYDSRANKWLFSVDTDVSPRAYHGLCTLNGLIYMIGGFDGGEYFNSMRCFDPNTHKWSERACMYYPRCYVSVAVHSGKIYALGGYNGRIRMSSAERYNPETNQWELITPMLNKRSDASAATVNDKIYIVGGFNGQEVMSSAEAYDTITKQWTMISPLNSARSGVSLIALGGTLYAIGGFNGYTRLSTGEKFNPEYSNRWTDIANMLTPRSNFATVILDDFIFAIGGFNDRFVAGSTTINYVEYFDADANFWYDAASMNVSRSALSACVVYGLQNAVEYTFLRGRENQRNAKGEGNG